MDLRRTIAAHLLGSHRLNAPSFDSRAQTGQWGDRGAADFLRWKRRFKILYRNYFTENGDEIDLVCRQGETLVFVEVRSLASGSKMRPADTVGKSKERRVARAANRWLHLLNRDQINVRIDLVEVVLETGALPKVNHIENAIPFESEEL